MNTFTIRPAAEADAPAIAAIDRACGAERDPRFAAWAREILALGQSWLAEAEGEAVAYALASRRFFRRPFVHLLMVVPGWRRHGLASELMARCEAAHDDDRLFVTTNTSNAPMRTLLAKERYAASGTIDNIDPGDPELVFVRFRSPAHEGKLRPKGS